jgi:predicted DNA-binding transcriptional regulator AlpA
MESRGDDIILLNAPEAWTLCHMKKTSWYKSLTLRAIPAPVRIKGTVRWRRQELLDWIEAGCPPQSKWRWFPKKSGK